MLSFLGHECVPAQLHSRDSDTLLRLRNDPETLRNSIDAAEVSPEEHARWSAKTLAAFPQRVVIAEIDGVPFGVVHLDWSEQGDGCDLSFTVAPEHRGKGYGLAIVEHAVQGSRM
jgi:UDP-4-amino-4,6-dideoxy-N-acetyl-beta-L-altrosamine N-acetyltransferase